MPEVTARKFLTKLATCMGETVTRYMDNDDLMDLVVSHINRMAGKSPLLILDDAGKLAHSALCTLIPLYDDTLHRLGGYRSRNGDAGTQYKSVYVGRVEGYDENRRQILSELHRIAGSHKEGCQSHLRGKRDQ